MNVLPETASDSPPTPQRDWRQLKVFVSLNSAFENADSQCREVKTGFFRKR
jgi:hypothetical protein